MNMVELLLMNLFKDVFNKKIDGSESSTAKGVNIATEFNEFKDVLFNKKIIRHKMKRIQVKKHKTYGLLMRPK